MHAHAWSKMLLHTIMLFARSTHMEGPWRFRSSLFRYYKSKLTYCEDRLILRTFCRQSKKCKKAELEHPLAEIY